MNSLKLNWLATSIVSFTLLSNTAVAQNTNPEIHLNVQNNWTGLYGGFNIGGVFNDADLKSNHFGLTNPRGTCTKSSNFSSFFPGVQLGYLHQFESKLVLGVEGDFTYTRDQTGKVACSCPAPPSISDHYSIKNRLQGSIRGRLGYSITPQILPFISAGTSFADLGMTYSNDVDDYYATNTSKPGWLVGAGLEWGFFHTCSLRVEYYYIDYNSMNRSIPNIYGLYDANGSAQVNLSANNIRLAVNHWF